MAVYTKFDRNKIEEILSNYNLGKLDEFKGIEEGIENTNYFLSIEKKKFILTIYEKRVKSEDLPFFSDLMSSLNKSNFKCPAPIINKQNKTITDFEGKKLMIVSFLEGKAKQNLSPLNCKSIGIEVAKMHNLNVFHGDLNINNIMISDGPKNSMEEKAQIWIIDFDKSMKTDYPIRKSDRYSNVERLKRSLIKTDNYDDVSFKELLNSYQSLIKF